MLEFSVELMAKRYCAERGRYRRDRRKGEVRAYIEQRRQLTKFDDFDKRGKPKSSRRAPPAEKTNTRKRAVQQNPVNYPGAKFSHGTPEYDLP